MRNNQIGLAKDRLGSCLYRYTPLLIILFLTSGFAAGFIGIIALLATLPLGALLYRAMRYEARYLAPGPGDSKFY